MLLLLLNLTYITVINTLCYQQTDDSEPGIKLGVN